MKHAKAMMKQMNPKNHEVHGKNARTMHFKQLKCVCLTWLLRMFGVLIPNRFNTPY